MNFLTKEYLLYVSCSRQRWNRVPDGALNVFSPAALEFKVFGFNYYAVKQGIMYKHNLYSSVEATVLIWHFKRLISPEICIMHNAKRLPQCFWHRELSLMKCQFYAPRTLQNRLYPAMKIRRKSTWLNYIHHTENQILCQWYMALRAYFTNIN